MRYRRQRIQDLLREEISSILFRDIKDPGLGFVTILEIKMTEDLKFAKIYYSLYGTEKQKEETAVALKRSRGYIKFLIGQRVKLKYTPDIEFIYDDRYDKMAKIEEILKRDSHDREDM